MKLWRVFMGLEKFEEDYILCNGNINAMKSHN